MKTMKLQNKNFFQTKKDNPTEATKSYKLFEVDTINWKGSYQPSNAMMLSFYGYFKQATIGPCKQKKPQFWDVVRKAKWDAWSSLGDLPKERAMQLYVDELRKIIETMSYTENVANFMGSVSELESINLDDLEAVAPGIMKVAQSHPNSPFSSRCNSPQPGLTANGEIHQNGHANGSGGESETDTYMISKSHHSQTVDQSDDEYTDTVEDNLEMPSFRKHVKSQYVHPYHSTPSELSDLPILENGSNHRANDTNQQLVLEQIQSSVRRMSVDFAAINQRMSAVEKNLSEVSFALKKMRLERKPEWWPFQDISPQWFVFLILWPFLANRLSRMIQRRK
ncbi:acyl-CoA-binding domain-containing protein 5 isoform X2 [Episyrphus balteatus]|uniref:acyl-CoA-binding domain-containing protein 5 isoform X2 n=1 Tax=Episyrphus balteatus TaxID=286459 RepID=UPI002485AE3C|nr:acyl-CoA-binding domain-containing protein 5 isoform X2 [Episyrphus balteatus]